MGHLERRAAMIATKAAPHLEPGERVQTGFVAQTGSRIIPMGVWTIIVTDRAFLAVRGAEAQRLPRDIRLGNPTGLYHTIQLDRAYRVHRQYYKEVVAADEALRDPQ